MTRKFRIFPLAIVFMSMMLGIKVVDFSFGLGSSVAEAKAPEKSDQETETVKTTPAAAGEDGQAQDVVTPVDSSLQLGVNPTRKEIEYLQKLSARRHELERRARELDDREKLLEAVEMRIVERTNSLKQIEETIEGLLEKHDEREKAQIESLVKIYSAMKPKDAAEIFNGLEEDVLISIVENMKEKKMGAILAKMNLGKAKELTTLLATRKKLPKIEG